MSWVCEACSKFISATSSDPLVSTKGLGWKNYHYACAQIAWGSRRSAGSHEHDSKDPGEAGVKETMSLKTVVQTKSGTGRGKFLVQCTFRHDGLRLSDFVNSLEEAEEYFNKQVRACPAGGGVDCAVLLVLKNGKQTQVDDHSFGMTSISQNHRTSGVTGSDDIGDEEDE